MQKVNWHSVLTKKGFKREIVNHKSTVWRRYTTARSDINPQDDYESMDIVERIKGGSFNPAERLRNPPIYEMMVSTPSHTATYNLHNDAERNECIRVVYEL